MRNNLEPVGKKSQLDNQYTQQSQEASDQSCDFSGDFQVNLLPAKPAKSKFRQFDAIPTSTINIRTSNTSKRPSIFIPPPSEGDNYLRVNDVHPQKEGSSVDIKVSNYPSGSDMETIQFIDDGSAPNSRRSSNQNPSSQAIENKVIRKSEPHPTFKASQYQEFTIKTNLMKQEPSFKKEKDKMEPVNNASYLTAQPLTKSRGLDVSRVINESRLTLKDYLFMASTSSKKAAEKKRRQLDESKKILKTEPAQKISQSKSYATLPTYDQIRQRFHKEKYHMSNQQMGTVIKESIFQEMKLLREKMDAVNHWMEVHQKIDNQELIQLHNLRRDIQECNGKFHTALQRLNFADYKIIAGALCDFSVVDHFKQGRVSGEFGEI